MANRLTFCYGEVMKIIPDEPKRLKTSKKKNEAKNF